MLCESTCSNTDTLRIKKDLRLCEYRQMAEQRLSVSYDIPAPLEHGCLLWSGSNL